jgi:LacI family transcriptional regulator
MANARDVAQLAGVSVSTVSRALAQSTQVSATTRERVAAVAAQLGYQPNTMARGLRLGRTHVLGLLVPDLENPSFASVTKGVQARARAAGYAVFVADSEESRSAEPALLAEFAQRVDGVIIASPRSDDESLRRAVGDLPVVLVNRDVPGLPSVAADDVDGVAQALGHLHALGHRTVAVAAGPSGSWSGSRRVTGLRQAAERLGDVTLVELGSFRPYSSGGYAAADHALASGATAVVAFNDLMALGMLDRFRGRGVRVPEDISVVGFDDVAFATLVSPAMTTVRVPHVGLGRSAVDLLVSALGAGADPADRTAEDEQLPVELVIRGSTGPLSAER